MEKTKIEENSQLEVKKSKNFQLGEESKEPEDESSGEHTEDNDQNVDFDVTNESHELQLDEEKKYSELSLEAEEDGSIESIDSCCEAFRLFDTKNEGRISREKIGPCLEVLNIFLTDSGLQELLEEIGSDDDGAVGQSKTTSLPVYLDFSRAQKHIGLGPLSFESFYSLVKAAKANYDPEHEMLTAFRYFDYEGRGYITAEELDLVLTSLDAGITPAEAEQIKSLVITRDRRFYYEPFVQTLKDMGLLDDIYQIE